MKLNVRKKTLKYLIFIIVPILMYQCDNHDKSKKPIKKSKLESEKKDSVVAKEVKKVKKDWDSLNRLNAEKYLTEFGKQNLETKVIIKTKFGDIKLRLYKDTPIHRANFIFLTKAKYFNSTVFYRVAKNFVIQGGNSDNYFTQKHRNKYGNYLLEPEFRKNRKHKYGALAAAREWDNNPWKLSSPFEFYIVHKRNGAHHLNNEHTVFGEVISGFDTMDKISKVEVGSDEWPKKDIKMTVEILD